MIVVAMKKYLVLLVVLLMAGCALASENMYWIRGESVSTSIMGLEEKMFVSTPPNEGSEKTVIEAVTEKGEHDFAKWFSPKFPQDVMVSGEMLVWFRSLTAKEDVVDYRWVLYDRADEGETEIVTSAWVRVPGNLQTELNALISPGYEIKAGHRLMLLLQYRGGEGGGNLKLELDEGQEGATIVWRASNGSTYSLKNVKSTAGIILGICSPEIECVKDSDCDDGESLTIDKCESAGVCGAKCTNTWCSPVCVSDEGCDDSNPLTFDSCRNEGLCSAYCENKGCEVQCSSAADCDDGDTLTSDSCKNPGTCFSFCENEGCDPGCAANADCDDSNPSTTDICVGAGGCNAVCVNLDDCGDAVCGAGETKCNCPQDCGICSETESLRICVSYSCDREACKAYPAADCCGNDICESGEDYVTCELDCKPGALELEVLGAQDGEFFLRGEQILVKVKATVDSYDVSDAEISVKGPLGEVNLSNDGRHNDDERGDAVYANLLAVGDGVEEGEHYIFIEGKRGNLARIIKHPYHIVPRLELSVSSDKDNYFLGDRITVTGSVKKRGSPVSVAMDANIVSNGTLVFNEGITPDSGGNFSFSYHSSFLDKEGPWKIAAYAVDGNRNYGFVEKAVNFTIPPSTSFLEVSVIEPVERVFRRGGSTRIMVSVADEGGAVANVAEVSAITPRGNTIALENEGAGTYTADYYFGWDFPEGRQKFEILAEKADGNTTYSGKGSFDVNISKIGLDIEVISPGEGHFRAGDYIPVELKISYPDGKLVENAGARAVIGENEVVLEVGEGGLYRADIFVEMEYAGKNSIVFEIEDPYGNYANGSKVVEVSGFSMMYPFRKYGRSILLAGIAALLVVVILGIKIARRRRISGLANRRKNLETEIKILQTQYFKEGTLSRKNYNEMMSKYEEKLDGVKKAIDEERRKSGKGK